MKFSGQILREMREARGYSQDELGALAGRNGQSVSNIENGLSQPTGYTMRLLAKAFGVTFDEFRAKCLVEDAREADGPRAKLFKRKMKREAAKREKPVDEIYGAIIDYMWNRMSSAEREAALGGQPVSPGTIQGARDLPPDYKGQLPGHDMGGDPAEKPRPRRASKAGRPKAKGR